MTFDFPGYDLEFVHKSGCKDKSAHLFTLIFKFYSPVTRYYYILRAEYHREDVFAIKFYVQQHSKSNYRYSKITNRKDIGNILVTCAKVIPHLLNDFPTASFGLVASRSVDLKARKAESLQHNQRFKAYAYFALAKFGTKTFDHIAYDKISSYLLINKKCGNILEKEKAIINMFEETYETVPDIV